MERYSERYPSYSIPFRFFTAENNLHILAILILQDEERVPTQQQQHTRNGNAGDNVRFLLFQTRGGVEREVVRGERKKNEWHFYSSCCDSPDGLRVGGR